MHFAFHMIVNPDSRRLNLLHCFFRTIRFPKRYSWCKCNRKMMDHGAAVNMVGLSVFLRCIHLNTSGTFLVRSAQLAWGLKIIIYIHSVITTAIFPTSVRFCKWPNRGHSTNVHMGSLINKQPPWPSFLVTGPLCIGSCVRSWDPSRSALFLVVGNVVVCAYATNIVSISIR